MENIATSFRNFFRKHKYSEKSVTNPYYLETYLKRKLKFVCTGDYPEGGRFFIYGNCFNKRSKWCTEIYVESKNNIVNRVHISSRYNSLDIFVIKINIETLTFKTISRLDNKEKVNDGWFYHGPVKKCKYGFVNYDNLINFIDYWEFVTLLKLDDSLGKYLYDMLYL